MQMPESVRTPRADVNVCPGGIWPAPAASSVTGSEAVATTRTSEKSVPPQKLPNRNDVPRARRYARPTVHVVPGHGEPSNSTAPLTGACCASPSRVTVTVDCAAVMSHRARWPNVRAASGTAVGAGPTWAAAWAPAAAEKPAGEDDDPGDTSQTGSSFVGPGGTVPVSVAGSRGSRAAQFTGLSAHVSLHSATKVAGCTAQLQS